MMPGLGGVVVDNAEVAPNFATGFQPAALRQARLAAGLSTEELAGRLGRTRTTVARWEAGSRLPQPSNVQALAAALGVSPEVLVEAPQSLSGLRASRGLSQAQVAEAIGVTQPAYARVESGRSGASYELVVALAELFGVNVDVVGELLPPRRGTIGE